jgi:hypothetical protein
MKRLLATALVFTAICSQAADLTVMGAPSCGEWIAARRNGIGWQAATNTAWLTGFLSGASVSKQRDALGPVDGDSIVAWMDKHCAANPLDRLDTAATVLYWELEARLPRK